MDGEDVGNDKSQRVFNSFPKPKSLFFESLFHRVCVTITALVTNLITGLLRLVFPHWFKDR